MENKPLISVVIPAYNEEKYLGNCLQSLKEQTFPSAEVEVIVVDNNSTDGTSTIAKNFPVRLVKETTQGYVYSLNRGMEEAKGEIVAVTDADTILDKGWLTVINNSFKDRQVVGITGEVIPQGKTLLLVYLGKIIYTLFLKITFGLGKPNLTGFNLAVRKSAYEKVGGLNLKYQMSPDVELGLKLTKVGKVKFISQMRVYGSMRRWEKNPVKTLWQYSLGYFNTLWFKKKPEVEQEVIR